MASSISSQALRRLASPQIRQSGFGTSAVSRCLRLSRPYSTETPQTPPLLSKLKTDLKTAMRNKDAARLSVLRAILAATTNAAKTSSPIKTDAQLVQLLRKTARGNQEAVEEARVAGRADLVEKETAQINIIDEYIADSGVQTLGTEKLEAVVDTVISEVKSESVDEKRLRGEVMKRLMKGDGPLEGKVFDRNELAHITDKRLS